MFNIIGPKGCSVEGFTMQFAERTRSALAKLVSNAKLPEKSSGAVLDKAAEKELREAGKAAFVKAYSELTDTAVLRVVDTLRDCDTSISAERVADVLPVAKLYLAINHAAKELERGVPDHLHIQGIVSAAKAAAYTNGIKVDSKETKTVAWLLASAPRCTSAPLDRAMKAVAAWPGINYSMTYCTEERYEEHPLEQYMPEGSQGGGYYLNARGLITTEGETPMFHGFLSADDFYTLRFTSTRVGAAVKQWGGTDEEARKATAACNTNTEYTYKLYPNDYPFGEIYIDFDNHERMGSCMSGAGFSGVPHDVHPADAYSAAHFGVEDNGLVLVVALLDNSIVGRGILNVNKNEVVRWYGRHKAWVQLQNTLDISLDSDALDDSWLALIAEGSKFAHPYVDGSCYAEIQGDRVVLGTGDIDVQGTSGYGYTEETRMCVYDDEFYPESEMTYQENSDTWIHNRHIEYAMQCAISGEYFHRYDMHGLIVDGEHQKVWDGIDDSDVLSEYSDIGGNIGWTRNPDQYIYDDETEKYYTESEYTELLSEREEANSDEDTNANAA